MAWQRVADVVYEVVDGRAVLVSADGREIITLNPVGSLVWEELDGHRDSPAIAAALIPRFDDVSASELTRDINEFLNELKRAGLIAQAES